MAKPPQHWSYAGPTGPAHWGSLEPGFAACKIGKRQSPIDIRDARKADLQPIRFSYKPFPLKIIDNGHTIQINVQSAGGIEIHDNQYSLVQFHFHKPSGELVGGKRFDMAVHLVHQDAAEHLAVVAVLLESGSENPLIQELWNHLPREKWKEYTPRNAEINAAGLLPGNRNYYKYFGSLTTPPCTEGVTWFVLKSPVEISSSQIGVFGKLYANNARPVQPVNGRKILESNF
ncbi:MAG: carbonic anhydrase family protein [Acidobacteriota bacterium]|nr:carbonic anhydrase family protein [Acidobacteriota bacterium]